MLRGPRSTTSTVDAHRSSAAVDNGSGCAGERKRSDPHRRVCLALSDNIPERAKLAEGGGNRRVMKTLGL
jgi:hypothetical protein